MFLAEIDSFTNYKMAQVVCETVPEVSQNRNGIQPFVMFLPDIQIK